MDERDTGQVDCARRQFLVAARGAGVLGAIAMLFGRDAGAETVSLPAARPAGAAHGGYRETEHIRKYYRSARYW